MSQPSNRLAILDELAITTGRDYRQSGESYMAAAAKLVKARDLCEHGEWGPHLEKTGIPERTATRMIRLARAGIKSATVADLGVGRVDEILAQVPEATAGLVWPETGETITGDEIVRMREYADCAHEIWRAFMDLAEKEENPWLKGRMIQAIPDGFHSADTWIRWYDDPCLSGYHPRPLYVVCLLGLQARAGAGALRRRSG